VTLLRDHREFGKEISIGSKLTVDAIIHFPTRYHLKDASGKIWTVPIHSVRLGSDAVDDVPEPAEEEE